MHLLEWIFLSRAIYHTIDPRRRCITSSYNLLLSFTEAEPPAYPGQPQSQDLLQADRPGISGRFPDLLDDPPDFRRVERAPSAALSRRRLALMGSPLIDFPDGVLAVVTADLGDFIEDASLGLLGTLVVAFGDGLHISSPALHLHFLTSSPEKIRLSKSALSPYPPW
jgi:hypothetical protein